MSELVQIGALGRKGDRAGRIACQLLCRRDDRGVGRCLHGRDPLEQGGSLDPEIASGQAVAEASIQFGPQRLEVHTR